MGRRYFLGMELDEEQRYAVDSEESMVCIAGPGSGKTRVLTEKASKLFMEGYNILCLCFTRSAAREMQERVPGLPATTIHSYCCGSVGWKEEWGYSGLLYRMLMYKDNPKFDWVLLDECQDVNELELDVVLSLIGGKLFAVGDPYQSIYGFQGALGPRVMGLLKAVGCKEWELHSNYRSCPKVVRKLNSIFDRKLISKNVKDTGLTTVLCRTNDDVFGVSEYLRSNSKAHRLRLGTQFGTQKEKDILGESSLRVMTIHQSKGLEFDKVLLFGWEPELDWEGEEKRVYYVAASRASREFKEIGTLEALLDESKN